MKAFRIILVLIIILSYYTAISVGGARPKKNKRKFSSEKVDEFIELTKNKFKDDDLAHIWENCFPNTLDTTVEHDERKEDTFIITGDIEAMWLRDSSFQIFPYLEFAKDDQKLKQMMLNLIKRQAKSVILDPYANAFNKKKQKSPWQSDKTYKLVDGVKRHAMNSKLWERKYELDSTISTLFFAANFYDHTGDMSFVIDETWQKAVFEIIKLVKNQMRGTDEEDLNGGPEYFFQRRDWEPFDSLHQGRGNPVNSCGLVKTMFRSSDDSAMFAYNIPENAFLVTTFRRVADMITKYVQQYEYSPTAEKELNTASFLSGNERDIGKKMSHEEIRKMMVLSLHLIAEEMITIAKSVEEAIYKHGVIVDMETGEKFFTFEVDCYGNHYFIDDPGYPSLISLPFFGFVSANDEIYKNTRKRILSTKNPYYIKDPSTGFEGLGSAHTQRRYIWPLFTIMRVLTSTDEKEITDSINLLIKSALKTGFIHESFRIDNFDDFTRDWFAWANSFFGYMINHVNEKYPHLLLKN